MRFRRWLYGVVGIAALMIGGSTWLGQIYEPFHPTPGLYLIGLVSMAVLVVAPIALFDFFRWLFTTNLGIRLRLFGLGSIAAWLLIGFRLGWEVSITERDYDVSTKWESSNPGISSVLGLVSACVYALAFWFAFRNQRWLRPQNDRIQDPATLS